jgi:pectinesterase
MKKIGWLLFFFVFAIIKANAQKKLVVAQDGSGAYKTVQEAINAVPDNSVSPTEIFVKKGIYKERIVIAKEKINIKLIGEDENATIFTYDNYASKLDTAGKPLGTSRTASVYVYGAGFSAKNVTFENSSGPVGQALAIYVEGDKAAFFNCRFLGFQDTIYTHGYGSREYYSNCYIEGTVDFIFGASTAFFEQCTIFCKKNGHYITAASTPDTTKYGYVLSNCKITGDAADHSFALGRPWRPYAKVVYLHCSLSNVISAEGWDNWRNAANEKTAYYAEYKNTGPGYTPGQRAAWSHQLSDDEAGLYAKSLVLNGWDPKSP